MRSFEKSRVKAAVPITRKNNTPREIDFACVRSTPTTLLIATSINPHSVSQTRTAHPRNGVAHGRGRRVGMPLIRSDARWFGGCCRCGYQVYRGPSPESNGKKKRPEQK